jgi:hypothetical protein
MKLTRVTGKNTDGYAGLVTGRGQLITKIEMHPRFRQESEERQKRLLSGEEMFIGGMRRAARLVGWNDDQFRA